MPMSKKRFEAIGSVLRGAPIPAEIREDMTAQLADVFVEAVPKQFDREGFERGAAVEAAELVCSVELSGEGVQYEQWSVWSYHAEGVSIHEAGSFTNALAWVRKEFPFCPVWRVPVRVREV